MTYFREAAKNLYFHLLGSNLALRLRLSVIKHRQPIIVLNFHRVSQDDGSAYRPLNPKIFDDTLIFLKRNFSIVTFEQILEPSIKPKMILSFDDGYKDFIEVSVPLLRKHGIRCNHNIIPECIESQLPPLNVMAQDFIGKAPRNLVQKLNIPNFDAQITSDTKRLGYRLSAFIKNRSHKEQEELRSILVPQFFEWRDFRPTSMMTLEDIRQIAESHELGGHSYSHSSMEYETDSFLREDVERCKTYFSEKIGTQMNIYAFPNGSCTDRQIDIVRGCGVSHILLVGEDFDVHPSIHSRFTFDGLSLKEAKFKSLGGLKRIPK